METKTCSKCGASYEPNGKSTRNASWCKPCGAAYMREYQKQNREKMRAIDLRWRQRNRDKIRTITLAKYHALSPEQKRDRAQKGRKAYLQREFGITVERYDEMLRNQNGLCAICGNPGGRRLLAVDHDHATGKVRELLCHYCNLALARVEGVPNWNELSLKYLEKHRC
jgi:hypothetical protein